MPYSRPYASGFVDYPSTTTPINSTALNTMDVGIKTANDQFQTVTTAQRTALTPTVGQCVWDSDLRQLMVFMNASGGNAWQPIGNRLVCASTSRPATPFEGQEIYETDSNKTYVYTGSTWLETGDLDNTGGASDAIYNSPIRRFAYTTRTSTLVCSGTSFATGTEVFASDITFTADGTSTYWVEFFLPGFNTDGTTHVTYFGLSDGSTTQIGLLTQYSLVAGFFGSTIQRFPYTPAAGSRSLNVRCWVSGSSSTIYAGVSGADFGPAYLAVYGGYLS